MPFRRTKRCIPTKARLRGARPQYVRDKRPFSVYLQLPAIKKQVLETANRFDVDAARRASTTTANHDTRVSYVRFLGRWVISGKYMGRG